MRGSSHELEKRRRSEKIKEEGRGEKNSGRIGSSKERKGVHSFSALGVESMETTR
jgi:hypothetical protein